MLSSRRAFTRTTCCSLTLAGFAVEDEEAGTVITGELEAVEHVADGLFLFHLLIEEPEEQVLGSVVFDLFGHLKEFVDLLGDELLLLQAVLKHVDGRFEGRFGFRDGVQLDLRIAVHEVLVKLQRMGSLFAALVKHLAREAAVGRLLKPRRHREVQIAGGHFVVDLLVEQLGEFWRSVMG